MNQYYSRKKGSFIDDDQVVKSLVEAFDDEPGATRQDVDDELKRLDLVQSTSNEPLQQREKYLLVSQAMIKIWENEYKKAIMRMEKTENNLLRLLDIQLEILRRGKGGKNE